MPLPRFRLLTLTIAVAVAAVPLWHVIEIEKANRRKSSLERRLRSLWHQQGYGIASGRFEIVMFRYFDADSKQLDRAEAVRRVEALGPSADEAAIGSILDELVRLGLPKPGPRLWGTRVDVVADAAKIANFYHTPRGAHVRTFDGKDEVEYKAVIKQASIRAGRGAIVNVDLDTICAVPRQLTRLKSKPEVELTNDGDVLIRSAGLTGRIDGASGFAKRLTILGWNGTVTAEYIQQGPAVMHGVALPRTIAQLVIVGDKVQMLTIYLIKSAHLNVSTSASDYWVKVPAGTKIFDFRRSPTSPAIVRLSERLDDVKRYVAASKR